MSQFFFYSQQNIDNNKCLNWEILHVNLKFDACYSSKKKLERRLRMAEKTKNFKKIQLGEHLRTN